MSAHVKSLVPYLSDVISGVHACLATPCGREARGLGLVGGKRGSPPAGHENYNVGTTLLVVEGAPWIEGLRNIGMGSDRATRTSHSRVPIIGC